MTDRDFHPIERIVRYGISGGLVSLLFSMGVVGFVHILPAIGPVGATVLAFCVVQPIGYAIHRAFTFPDTDPVATGGRARLGRFIVTNLGSIVVAAGDMALVTDVLHASYVWGIALNWVLVPCTSFVFYRFWVFEVRSRRSRTLT